MHEPNALPWTRSCFVCGAENPHGLQLRSHTDGSRVWIDFTPRPCDVGYRQIVHGGILSTLLDEVMTWAAILAARRMCVAAEICIRLRSPARVGAPLHVEGGSAQSSRRLIVTEGAIRDAAGNEVARATGKYMPMAEADALAAQADFVHDPRAIAPARLFGHDGP